MIRVALALGFFLVATACASSPPLETRVIARSPSALGVATVAGDADWYATHPPAHHYLRAIADDDLSRLERWLALELPADYRASPEAPSAIQAALAAQRRELVRLLLERPHVELRPNPHRPIALCPSRPDHLVVNMYELIAFGAATATYARSCRAEDYYDERELGESTLTITPFMLEMFLAVAGQAASPTEFKADVRSIRHALRASPRTGDPKSANAHLLDFIERY